MSDSIVQKKIIEKVLAAGRLLRNRFYVSTKIEDKAPGDQVTTADREIEDLLLSSIRRIHPGAALYAEERGGMVPAAASGGAQPPMDSAAPDQLFIIDPIDGTANFIFGVPHFAISIAEFRGGQPVLGVIHNPLTGDLFLADKSGAYRNRQPIRVSRRTPLAEAFVILGFSANSANIARYQAEWPAMFGGTRKTLPLLSPSLNLCAVASGKADAFIDFGCSFEGQAAGAYLVQQAGGRVRDYGRDGYDPRATGIVAENGMLGL